MGANRGCQLARTLEKVRIFVPSGVLKVDYLGCLCLNYTLLIDYLSIAKTRLKN